MIVYSIMILYYRFYITLTKCQCTKVHSSSQSPFKIGNSINHLQFLPIHCDGWLLVVFFFFPLLAGTGFLRKAVADVYLIDIPSFMPVRHRLLQQNAKPLK